jgi:hypothetical protein
MVYDFERNKIAQQEIEVKALVALLKHSKKYREVAEMRLFEYSFPDEVAKAINQETFEKLCPKCNKWDCGAGAAGGLCVYSTKEEIKKWEDNFNAKSKM